MKFKIGDIIRTQGDHFAEREIVDINEKENVYVTRFLEDDSMVTTIITVIDTNYKLK